MGNTAEQETIIEVLIAEGHNHVADLREQMAGLRRQVDEIETLLEQLRAKATG